MESDATRYALNYAALQSLLGVPNLAGEWHCLGNARAISIERRIRDENG